VKKLRTILRYIGSCDGDMEKGNLRADVNVSVRPAGRSTRHALRDQRTSNSYRHIREAIEHEARRPDRDSRDGGKIAQQTRLFDPAKGETRSMRSKEESDDYRYFPDPDLLPLELDPAWIKALEATLPELPDAKKARLQSQLWPIGLRRRGADHRDERADLYEAGRGRSRSEADGQHDHPVGADPSPTPRVRK